MSYATIISICPAEINCSLPHTTPARVSIPAGEISKPSLAVFSDALERQYIGIAVSEKNPWATYPVLSLQLANIIVDDYRKSATYVEPNAYPGVFAVSGKPDGVNVSSNDVVYVPSSEKNLDFVNKFPTELAKAKEQQWNWFKKLVNVADKSFAKNNNHAEISTLQRYASKVLNLDRAWNKEIKPEDFRKCPFCASFVEPMAVICKECHNVVDNERFKILKDEQDKVVNPLKKLG